MISLQIQQPQNSDDSISIENIETSIQGLVKRWLRRQKWQLVFHCHEENINEATNRAPWRISLAKFLESTPVRVLALVLLLLDLVFTVLDLSSSLVSCTTKKNNNDDEDRNALYHWGGIAILSVLTFKMLALAVALGTSFFKRPGHVVDGFVVTSALVLESFVKDKGAGLLVVVSLWRVVRVIESAFELSDEAIEAQIEGIVHQFEALRNENRSLRESLVEKDKRITELEDELARQRHV